jgi:hypothetical protein
MKKFIALVVGFVGLLLPFSASAATNVASYYSQTDFEGVGDNSARTCIGEQFQPSISVNVTAVGLKMELLGAPADNVTVALYSTSAGTPGSSLESGTSISNASFNSSSYTFATSTFAGTTLVNTGTTYWVVACRSGAINASNYYRWGVSNTSPPYGGYYKYSGTSWTLDQTAYNTDFEVDGTAPVSAAGFGYFNSFWW